MVAEVKREQRIELARAMPDPYLGYPDEGLVARRALLEDRVRSLNPADGLETMLAEQMATTHSIVMDCFARAHAASTNPVLHAMHLNHAAKFQTLYMKQMSILDKHRAKGEQKVVVEYVNIESGGKAVVGSVDARR
jgi:hypothetical protein